MSRNNAAWSALDPNVIFSYSVIFAVLKESQKYDSNLVIVYVIFILENITWYNYDV